jgi:hypothetical protein
MVRWKRLRGGSNQEVVSDVVRSRWCDCNIGTKFFI